MKKLLGVALLGALAAAPAGAQTVNPLCGAFAGDPAEATICVSANFTLHNANTLYVDIFNGAAGVGTEWASRVWGIALFNIPGTVTFSGAYFSDNGVLSAALADFSAWTPPGGQFAGVEAASAAGNANGEGGPGGIVTCEGPNSGGGTLYRTCENGDFVRFVFALGTPSPDISMIDWGFRAQSIEGINGESIHCASTLAGNGTGGAGSLEHLCGDSPDTPQEIVPEPATMTLLATGLAGMAAARRRRKNNA